MKDQQRRPGDRPVHRRRLGWDVGLLNPTGGKPKGMRRRTFERMTAEHDAFAGVSLAGMAQRLGLMNRRLDGLRDDLNGGGSNLFRNIVA